MPVLQQGDLVLATQVSGLDGRPLDWAPGNVSEPVTTDSVLMARARAVVEMSGIDFTPGPVLSLPTIARTSAMKTWIGEKLGPAGVDIESYTACRAAVEAGVPFTVARAVVDVVGYDLPQLVDKVDRGPYDGRLWSTLRYLARRPWEIAGTFGLAGSAASARRSITHFCREFSLAIDGASGGSPDYRS